MKKILFTSWFGLGAFILSAQAIEISAVPGPDDQDEMIMPMVTIRATSGMADNPTSGIINVNFSPPSIPQLRPLTYWSSGNWFAESANWRPDLSPIAGTVPGMPSNNAGAGDLFNNQYGFMFMTMGTMMMANIPSGKSLAIKLSSISSPFMESFNYSNSANRWDEVWTSGPDSQVLWNGSMWHNYFTLPSNAAEGTYTASFEIFIANIPFTGSTGFAQYDAAALAATKDTSFTSATVNYTWTVIPEPSSALLVGMAVGFALIGMRRKFK